MAETNRTYDIKELADKWARGTINDDERAYFEEWYRHFDDTEVLLNDSRYKDTEQLKAQIFKRLKAKMDGRPEGRIVPLWKRVAVAASVLLVVGAGLWFFFSPSARHPDPSSSRTAGRDLLNDIAPGKNGATITLANGKVIALDSAKNGVVIGNNTLVYSDGSQLSNDSRHLDDRRDLLNSTDKRSLGTRDDGRMQTLTASTTRGQTYQFTLPDGTKVWLNADSKISFPSYFDGGYRKILLSGEAYFEVAKDKLHPFIVNTDATASRSRLDVEVLGTHFNINSYEDEKLATATLLEGEVTVNGTYMKPGRQAVLMGKGLIISDVDAEAAIDWKNGLFMFDGESLENIMKKVSRWYNVDVVFADEKIKGLKFSGSVSRFDKVSELLDQLAHTQPLEFSIEKRTITVNNK